MTCAKVGYTSKHRAREAVRAMGNSVRAYRCPECKMIHVTKERQKLRKRTRKSPASPKYLLERD